MPSCRPSPSIEYPPPHFHIGELRGFAFFGPFIKALQRRWCFPCSLNSSIFFDASVAFGLIQYGARIISSEEADVRVERYRSMVVSEEGKQNTKARRPSTARVAGWTSVFSFYG